MMFSVSYVAWLSVIYFLLHSQRLYFTQHPLCKIQSL